MSHRPSTKTAEEPSSECRRTQNRILLENFFLLGDSEGQIAAFIERYNYRRFRENLESQSG